MSYPSSWCPSFLRVERANQRNSFHPSMGDGAAAVPPRLGFVGQGDKQQMEIEGGGSGSAEIFDPARGKKRPLSPATPCDDLESLTSTTSDERDKWLLSDSSSDEDEDNQDTHRRFTVADFPRASCDFKQQDDLLYKTPHIKLRGPRPIKMFPWHTFASDYNLAEKSEITVRDVGDCSNGCRCFPMDLLQFVSVKIAGYRHTGSGPAKISGFVAAREPREPLRNYVYRREIDNCEAVTVKPKTGVARLSLISPARVISFLSHVLIEFELHARSEEKTDGDNGPIIEGRTELYNMFGCKSFMRQNRLYGEGCALDMKYLVLVNAIEASVVVKVLRLGATLGGINMKFCAKTSDFDDVICLFQGAAPDLGKTVSFVVAAERRKGFEFYIEGSSMDGPILGQKPLNSWWQCYFPAGYHDRDDEKVAYLGEVATVSVKVMWRTYWKGALRG